ncbi:MAG: EamA family transporter [Chitinophagales bacterium]|nr:EamA family transporter [Chitinophagales bacterium]
MKTHLALFLVNLIYAANYTVAKEVMPNFIQPFGFIFLRVISALIFFLITYLVFIKEKIHRSDWWRLIACGVFGVAINQLMFFKGLNITTPINAALIMISTPIMVFVISFFLRTEKMTYLKIAGLMLGAIGYLMVVSGNDFSFSSDTMLGDIFIWINASSYGLYLILVKPLMRKYNPLTVIFYVFLFGFFIVSIAGFSEFRSIEWHTFTPSIWISVAYVVFGTTILAYLLNIYALSKVNPSVVSIYIYLQPVLASLIAVSFGKDVLDVQKITAAALILSGVFMVTQRKPFAMFTFKKQEG